MFDGKSDADAATAQGGDKDQVTAWAGAVHWEPGSEKRVAGAPNSPFAVKNRRWLRLDALNLSQRNALVAAEGKIVVMKNDLLVSDLDEAVLMEGLHRY